MCRASRLATASVLCLAIAGIPVLAAEHAFDGVYSGKRVLTKGSDSDPMCPAEEGVSLTIRGATLTFANSALKNFIISFNPGQDGSFASNL
jgi:hypothetical protein